MGACVGVVLCVSFSVRVVGVCLFGFISFEGPALFRLIVILFGACLWLGMGGLFVQVTFALIFHAPPWFVWWVFYLSWAFLFIVPHVRFCMAMGMHCWLASGYSAGVGGLLTLPCSDLFTFLLIVSGHLVCFVGFLCFLQCSSMGVTFGFAPPYVFS